ncbi:pyridoxamine 5'-phosphate oxidase family protein [Halobacteria archaeon AArc-dxtr1]|nr:pyridoxamine 5'-phosphate oxidase family protein [Halobacteria archaeon AArc-dxtr1]
MAIKQEVEMSAAEVDEFLGRHETGVLSLARADEPYAIPISYGYDDGERQVYLRLVSVPDSEKRRFLDADPDTRLVVYDESDAVYRSVIVTGTLENVSPAALTPEEIVQYGQAKRPLFEIWADGKADLDIELYRIDAAEIAGRRTVLDREE